MAVRGSSKSESKVSWLAVAGLVLNVSLAILNAIIAYGAFNNDNLVRLNRVEDRVDILWADWREDRRQTRQQDGRGKE